MVEVYSQVADLLDAGLTLDEIRVQGLVVEGDTVDWDQAVSTERLILAGQENFCALLAQEASQGS